MITPILNNLAVFQALKDQEYQEEIMQLTVSASQAKVILVPAK